MVGSFSASRLPLLLCQRTGSCDLCFVKFRSERDKGCVHSAFSLNNQAHVLTSSHRTACTACTAPWCGVHFPQWNRLYSPGTAAEILLCPQNQKSGTTSAAAVWHLTESFSDFLGFFLYTFNIYRYIFRLGGVFMNCSVWRQWSGWWVGGQWHSCIIHEEGGRGFSSLTEKLCSWSGSTASRLLTWYFRDSDINCRSALGIILQRNFWDFEGGKKKCRNDEEEEHWLTLHVRGWSQAFSS